MKIVSAKKISVLLLLVFSSFLIISCNQEQPVATEVKTKNDLVPALNAYSFADLLRAKSMRSNEQVYTLFNLLDWCESKNIEALDPTAYFFPTYPEVPSDEYLERFKNRAADLGIAISGTGIRNNFASPDSMVRREGIDLAKEWIVAASKIGAPVIRVFAGAIPEGYEEDWEVPAQWMVDCYKELLPVAEQYGVRIGIQNHGEMLQTAEQCLYIMKALDSDWAGIIVDTGNFKTPDPYKDIAEVVPYAINWQIKESPYGLGSEIKTDYKKLVEIIRSGGYTGYLPVETLYVKGEPYDPFVLVSGMIDALHKVL